jgi:hypothetical protein
VTSFGKRLAPEAQSAALMPLNFPARLLLREGSELRCEVTAIDPDSALIKAWRLRSGVTMDRSPPYTQALNPVERSNRRFNQLIYDNLRSQYLSAWPRACP